jgi:hypothetical protein
MRSYFTCSGAAGTYNSSREEEEENMRHQSIRTPSSWAVISIFITLFAAHARAAPLLPGGILTPPPLGASPAGAVHVDGTVQAFSSQDMPLQPNGTSFTGVLTSDVWRAYPGNPFGASALTFTFRLANNGPDPLHRLVTPDYSGFATDVGFDAVTVPGVAPHTADRDTSSSIIGWNYDLSPRLPAGSNSPRLIIHTNATQYTPSLASVINSATASALSFGPTVPEPATLGLFAAAGALTLLPRRRPNA